VQSLLKNINNTAASVAKICLSLCLLVVAGCASGGSGELPSAQFVTSDEGPGPQYVVGPLDLLEIFVWQNPELSRPVTVRPDGRFSMPLIDDIAATGKTPTQLARDIEVQLDQYLQSPIVTVIVGGFTGPFAQQVRVVGSAAAPQAIPYRANMTLLDVMIAVGGLTEFAAGNSSTLTRVENSTQREYTVRLDDLLKDGDVSANVKIEPGDVIIVPESFF
tara:strand:- start:154644 stop:155300 length:657 start_codon:yes stop_codon:yes gene_type:complete